MALGDKIRAADAFRSAFRVAPEVWGEVPCGNGLVIYGWNTPEMDGFELPETDELVLALHLGGSRAVRAVTETGLSDARSTPGRITLLPPGRPVAFRTAGSIRVATLHLPRPAQPDDPLAQLAQRATLRFAFRDAFVSAAMEALLHAARSAQPPRPDYMPRIAEALLCHLSQLASWSAGDAQGAAVGAPAGGGAITHEPLRALLAYVDAHLDAKLSLDRLAARAGMSRTQFTRGFRDATGLSVHQYLLQRRIEVAKRLLRDTPFDLARIAQDTGFSSQSHFTGRFRALTGQTPARYRERH